jgi:hypothetical protein
MTRHRTSRQMTRWPFLPPESVTVSLSLCAQEDHHSDRFKPKSEPKKDKRTKRHSAEDSSTALLEQQQQEHKTKSPTKTNSFHFASSKNPLQVDDETIDTILQDLRHSAPHLPRSSLSAELDPPPESTPGGRCVRETVERLNRLLDQGVTPRLTLSRSRISTATDALLQPAEGSKNKRKKKVQVETSDRDLCPPEASLEPEQESLASSVVDITEALASLSLSQEPLSAFSTTAQFLFSVLNKEFGCLSSISLFFALSRLPLQPLHSLSRSQPTHRQDKDPVATTPAPQSLLERILASLCRSLHLQPALITHFSHSPSLLSTVSKAEELLSITDLLFSSGTAVALIDLTHFSLVLIQRWGEKTFPLVLQHHQKQISKQESAAASARKIFWPPFILSVLPNLFAIVQRLLSIALKEWASLQASASPWVTYVCSSGFIDQISVLFRELQCVADFCEKDEFVSFLLCQLSQVIRDYSLLIRFVSLCLSPHSCPSLLSPCRHISQPNGELLCSVALCCRKSDISWNIISLLGVLLLQDGVQSHSYRRQSHLEPDPEKSFLPSAVSVSPSSRPHPTQRRKASRHSTSSSTAVAEPPSDTSHSAPPSPINHLALVVCFEIVSTLNQLCQLEVSVVQILSPQIQVTAAAVTLLLTPFPSRASLFMSPSDSSARVSRRQFLLLPRPRR